MIDYSASLREFDERLSRMYVRGQWTVDPGRREAAAASQGYGSRTEPKAAGVPHLWRWSEISSHLVAACEALPESFTARRALAFRNPELPRCAAQTLGMAIQAIRPREIAWAHRHTAAALRFVIKGTPDLVTVVDGVACPMEENDLVLTPSWTWHDHRNDSDEIVYWVDVLDVPFVGTMSAGFYEELGNVTQSISSRDEDGNDWRYTWRSAREALRASDRHDPCDGVVYDYPGRNGGGPTLPTLGCSLQRLPAGFEGKRHRHTSSTVYHVVSGTGTTLAGDATMHWSARDCFVVPNWTWHSHQNRSASSDAVLFAVTDAPALHALGYHRVEA